MKKNLFLCFKCLFWECIVFLSFSSFLFSNDSAVERNIEFFQRVVSNQKGLFFEGYTWIKNGQICVEFEKEGQLYTSLIKDNTVYRFSTISSKGTMSTLKKNNQNIFSSDFFSSKVKLAKFLESVEARKMENSLYEGEDCEVYQYESSYKKKKIMHTLWIWEKGFFPLKIEILFSQGEKISIFYDSIVINGVIADKRFLLPKHVRFG